MNLPTVAILLEDHPLVKVYGGGKMVHLINSKIPDVTQHIDLNMTGRDITELYRSLDYTLQMDLVGLELYDESEATVLINQIELLNSATDSEGKMSDTVRDLVVIFAATILLLLAGGICMAYYVSSRQSGMSVDSQLVGIVTELVGQFTTE